MTTKETCIRLLKNVGNIKEARRLHKSILEHPHCRDDGYLANLLVLAYGRCGSIEDARWVFDHGTLQKNIYSWNLMLQAFAQNGHCEDAITTYQKMPGRDVISSTAAMGAYAQQGNVDQTWNLFEEMNGKNFVCWNAMVAAYAQWCHFEEATGLLLKMPKTSLVAWTLVIQANALAGNMDLVRNMFDSVPQRDVILCTAVVQGYAQNGQLRQSKWVFDRMPQHNAIACSTMSQAYAECGNLDEAKASFDTIRWGKSVFSWTSLMQAYALNNHVEEAVKMFHLLPQYDIVSCTTMVQAAILNSRDGKHLFDSMPWRNRICWNTLVSAYAQSGNIPAAENVLDRLPQRNAASWTAIISAYGSAGRIQEAEHVFHSSMLERSFYTWNIMLQNYIKHQGYLERAKETFHKMPQRDLVTWNSMAVGYAQNGLLKDAAASFASMPERDVYSWNAYLAAHSRGPVQNMRKFFDEEMSTWKNKHSYNIMLAAYAQNVEATAAMDLAYEMVLEGFKPDEITLSSILTCCSYIGLVDTGRSYFVWVTAEFGLMPRAEDYTCIIGLLTRAGKLEDARELLLTMPFVPDGVAWTTLLAASMEHGDMKRASQAAVCAMQEDKNDGAPYILLSNGHMM